MLKTDCKLEILAEKGKNQFKKFNIGRALNEIA